MVYARKHKARLSLAIKGSIIDDITTCDKGNYISVREQLVEACEPKTGNELFGPVLANILIERIDHYIKEGIETFVTNKDFGGRATRTLRWR